MGGRVPETFTEPRLFNQLAHEFLNPLASLRGCALTILADRDHLPGNVVESLLDVVVRQSEKLEWLVRATTGTPRTSEQPGPEFDARRVVEEAARFAGVDVDFRAQPGHIRGDASRVRIAL